MTPPNDPGAKRYTAEEFEQSSREYARMGCHVTEAMLHQAAEHLRAREAHLPAPRPRCPACAAPEVERNTPWTTYACGSKDYDQRPGTFKHLCGAREAQPSGADGVDEVAVSRADAAFVAHTVIYEGPASFRRKQKMRAALAAAFPAMVASVERLRENYDGAQVTMEGLRKIAREATTERDSLSAEVEKAKAETKEVRTRWQKCANDLNAVGDMIGSGTESTEPPPQSEYAIKAYNKAKALRAEVSRLTALADERAWEQTRLRGVIERDRRMYADCINEMQRAIGSCWWMVHSRGSYEYDDNRYQNEFGASLEKLDAILKRLGGRAADWSDSPRTEAELREAIEAAPQTWELAYREEARKFQQETLRTSELTQLLQRFVNDVHPEHTPGAWSRGCVRCELVKTAMELLARPINAAIAQEKANG